MTNPEMRVGGAIDIRDMAASDIPAAVQALRRGDWGERGAFYDLVFAVPRCRPLVAVLDGEIVGTGVATINGPMATAGGVPTGWIGLIWVAPQMRRQGLGAALTEAVAGELAAAGCRTAALVASPLGRPVYDRLGFVTQTEYAIFEAGRLPEPPSPPPSSSLRPMSPSDLPAVFALDARATGEDRSQVLSALSGNGWIIERGAELRGFLLPTDQATGAVIAVDPASALCLLDVRRHLVAPGTRARAGVVNEHADGRRRLAEHGWQSIFTSPRMLRGAAWPWQPELIWGLLSFAMG